MQLKNSAIQRTKFNWLIVDWATPTDFRNRPMTTAKYFDATDYDLTLRLQALFDETVELQDQIDRSRIENVWLKEEQRVLTLKLNVAHKEISLLVRKMKHLLFDTETAKTGTPQTISASKRTNRLQQIG
jgi:hypothetical protein